MKKMILLALLFAGVSAQAQNVSQEAVKFLDCMEPVFLDDPSFQQGSEKFFDVLFVDQKIEIKFTSGDLRSEKILPAANNTAGYFSLNDGSFYSRWENGPRVEMVLRDFGNRWRGTMMFPQGFQSETLNLAPGAEIDLACVLKPGAALVK